MICSNWYVVFANKNTVAVYFCNLIYDNHFYYKQSDLDVIFKQATKENKAEIAILRKYVKGEKGKYDNLIKREKAK